MKKLLLVLFISCFSLMADAKEKGDKTFLIIFDKEELKLAKSSAPHIELNFLDTFDTRSYTGNSESAILVTVPFTDWNTCDMGNALVILGDDRLVNLEEIAFRIIDIDASQDNFNTLLSISEQGKSNKKGNTIKLSLQ